MTFKNLNNDELALVADFFVKDVVSVKDAPTKKELLAALASGDPADENDAPVTWEDYQNIFLPAQGDRKPAGKDLTSSDIKEVKKVEEKYEPVLVKMERANPRFDIRGYTFTKEHPYRGVRPEDADYLVRFVEGFRLAAPSEVNDYYG